MKAIRLHEIGGPENLVYEDVSDPEPGAGEIVVRLHAAALNRRDVFVTRGQYPGAKPDALPVILGSDGSGEVVARGRALATASSSPTSASRTPGRLPAASRGNPASSTSSPAV